MRVPINLASQPFRADRPFIATGTILAVILTLLLGFLVMLIYQQHNLMRDARADVEQLEKKLASLQKETGSFETTIRRPDNAFVLERNAMFNTLIGRKGISWTRIFADLERVMPGNVRLISVRLPQINRENRVTLDMFVGASEQAPILDLLKRLEASPVFGATTVHSFQPPSQNEPLYRYRVSVSYAQQL